MNFMIIVKKSLTKSVDMHDRLQNESLSQPQTATNLQKDPDGIEFNFIVYIETKTLFVIDQEIL